MSEQPPAKPLAHLDAPNAGLYRRVMGVFVAAKRRFLVHLRPEDLTSSLEEADGAPADLATVEAALKQLEDRLAVHPSFQAHYTPRHASYPNQWSCSSRS
jgi:hypothetical protein